MYTARYTQVLSCSIFFVALLSVGAASQPAGNETAVYRANQTLHGLLDYYWKSDVKHKFIKFVFVCAQIGSVDNYGSCTCADPHSCVDCYRWWSAVALESVATFSIYTNSSNYSGIPDVIFNHSPYNAEWNATASCTFIDDFAWYGIAYLRVYEWLNVSIQILKLNKSSLAG